MKKTFLRRIDRARRFAGVPFVVASGYRCPNHNRAIGSVTRNHPSGCAADIETPDMAVRLAVLKGLVLAGFRRIGLRESFIHADAMDETGDSDEAPRGCWL